MPNDGDLIEISRGHYEHWAVYVGNDFVVHLTLARDPENGAANAKSDLPAVAIVRKEKLLDVVGSKRGSKAEVNNSLDLKYKPRPVEIIVQEAEERVGEKVSYNVFSENCEHFATDLRYGKARSRQAIFGIRAAIAGLGVGGVYLAVKVP